MKPAMRASAGLGRWRRRNPTAAVGCCLDFRASWSLGAHCTAAHRQKITIVPEATHLFEEPGKLEVVAQAAADWFADHWPTLIRQG